MYYFILDTGFCVSYSCATRTWILLAYPSWRKLRKPYPGLNMAWLQKRVEAKARDAIPHFPNSDQCKSAYSLFR